MYKKKFSGFKNICILEHKYLPMKKGILTVMVSGIFMVSCSQKGTAVQAGSKVSESDRIAQGKVIFDNSCGKCHDLPDPKSHNDDEWIGIVNIMAKKSKLTDEQGTLVYEYITANN